MTDKFKKLNKQFVLSDSTVNEYGFRLLTEGYQLAEFQKNPIGYYMHRREDGVVLKWEDLHIEDDRLFGTPVINLSNERGLQTCDEAENGFLNAASVGHIVVLEYSNDPELMLPGQTGPTITKWYNKECSLVDIPGNCNALTQLYDAQENAINLVDLNTNPLVIKKAISLTSKVYEALNLASNVDETILLQAISDLSLRAERGDVLEAENILLRNDKHTLQSQLQDLQLTHTKYEVIALLDCALEDKKITNELRDKLYADYTTNPDGLKNLLSAMPAYRSIAENLKQAQQSNEILQWSWDDFETKDPAGKKLKELKADHPERYQEIFKEKFSVLRA